MSACQRAKPALQGRRCQPSGALTKCLAMFSIRDRAKLQGPIFGELSSEGDALRFPALRPQTSDRQKIRSGLCVIPYERNQAQRSGQAFHSALELLDQS